MLRQVAAVLTATARKGLNRGLVALAWAFAAAGLATVGVGLLLAAMLIALLRLMGPLAACGLMGLVLVLAAVLIVARLRPRPAPPPPEMTPPGLTPDQHAFSIGFALARMILARRP